MHSHMLPGTPTGTASFPWKLRQRFSKEIATMEFPFKGIPTIPARKDKEHMVFYCRGGRYRVTAYPHWTMASVKKALWAGGIERENDAAEWATPGLQKWEDLTLIYAMQHMDNDKRLEQYGVLPGCQCLIAIETVKLR